jgi:DNA-binding response OmpR family regulator
MFISFFGLSFRETNRSGGAELTGRVGMSSDWHQAAGNRVLSSGLNHRIVKICPDRSDETGGANVRVLLVEDHKPLSRALKRGLEEEGFAVDLAEDGEEGDYKARAASYDVIVLDLMLPKKDGLTLLREWRRDGMQTHVLCLTAKDTTDDKVKGLDRGADDYLTKPFQLEELLARLRALIRRQHQVKDPVIRVHDLELDTSSRTVRRGGQAIHLTPREYALLQFLAFHRGKVVTRSMIWEHLYDEHDENTSNVVDVYIRYLRTKIDKGFEVPLILTRWGEGYLLRGDPD